MRTPYDEFRLHHTYTPRPLRATPAPAQPEPDGCLEDGQCPDCGHKPLDVYQRGEVEQCPECGWRDYI